MSMCNPNKMLRNLIGAVCILSLFSLGCAWTYSPSTVYGSRFAAARAPVCRGNPLSLRTAPMTTKERSCRSLLTMQTDGSESGSADDASEQSVEDSADAEANLDVGSPAFLSRKIEVLESELAEAKGRIGELEAELAPLADMQAKKILTKPSVIELRDSYLRLAADFDNYRKRAGNELALARDAATAVVLKELLVVLDNFERAAGAIQTETEREERINTSYQAVNKQLLTTLTKLNVEAIEALGQAFDPNIHNAIQQMESTEYAEGVVCQGLQRGYRVGERVLRPALVIVSSGLAGPGPATPEGGEAPAEAAEEAAEAA